MAPAPRIDLYVGIDPGLTNLTLVAYSPTGGVISICQPKSKLKGVQRLSFLMAKVKEWFGELQKLGDVKHIAMEHYSMAEKFGQHASGEGGAAVKLALVGWFGFDNRVAYPTLPAPNQVKKFLGNGKLKKSMMAKEVLKRYGEDFMDDNVADAYVLARVAHGHAVPDEMMTRFQQEVIVATKSRNEWTPLPSLPSIKTPKTTKRQSSSKSAPHPTPAPSRASSPTGSTPARRFASVPLAPRPSTRRSSLVS